MKNWNIRVSVENIIGGIKKPIPIAQARKVAKQPIDKLKEPGTVANEALCFAGAKGNRPEQNR